MTTGESLDVQERMALKAPVPQRKRKSRKPVKKQPPKAKKAVARKRKRAKRRPRR